MKKETVDVQGMHCASCASLITKKLKKIDGVDSCEVNYATEQAHISFDTSKTSINALNTQIKQLGYTFLEHSLHADHAMMNPITSDNSVKEHKLAEVTKYKTQFTILLPMIIISIAMMSWQIGADSLHLWAPMTEEVMDFFHHVLPIFATYALFVVGIPYLQAVGRFIRYRVANMDTLVGIGTLVAYVYSFIVSAFEKSLTAYVTTQQNYYDVTIVVIGFIVLGKFLELRSKLQTGESIEKLLELQVKKAFVLRDGKEIELPIDQVVAGDLMLIKPGAKIPTDGLVIEGSSSVDESMITGESIPVEKTVNATVIGGTVNKQGILKVEAKKVGKETMLWQIISMVEDAQGSKAPIEHLADKVSGIFVPLVLILSSVVFLVWALSGSFAIALLCFVGVLVIACPCAMGLATPTAIVVGVGKAAQHGILVKNAETLERLTSVTTVIFDKTGTLTTGKPEVTDIIPTDPQRKEGELLQILASLEAHSLHPLAKAVVEKSKTETVRLVPVTEFLEREGKGVQGVIAGSLYWAGNSTLAQEYKADVDLSLLDKLSIEGKSPLILGTGKEVLAIIGIADTIKEEAATVVSEIQQLGISVILLSGDRKEAAHHIASQAGISTVIAEVLPQDKATEVKRLQENGQVVAMIGDGINDAPALATADVGIAMSTGMDVAIESAGITILGGGLTKLSQALILSRETMKVVKQNLFWAFFYNIIAIPIAAGGLFPAFGILLNPAIAGAAMAFSSVTVVLNSLRLKRIKL